MVDNPFAPSDKFRIGQHTGCVYWPLGPFRGWGPAGHWLTMAAAFEMVAPRVLDTGDRELADLLWQLSVLIRNRTYAPRIPTVPFLVDFEALEADRPFLDERLTQFLPWYLSHRLGGERRPAFPLDPWLELGSPLWIPDEVGTGDHFNPEGWRIAVQQMVGNLYLIDNHHRAGMGDTLYPLDIVKPALVAVAIHDDGLPVDDVPVDYLITEDPNVPICAQRWSSQDVADALAAAGKEWWDIYRQMLPTRGAPSEIGGSRLTTGVLQKCKDPYEKSGRPWCIYKHKESDWDEPLKRQPKGWPKHYKTKSDAERALRIMQSYRDD